MFNMKILYINIKIVETNKLLNYFYVANDNLIAVFISNKNISLSCFLFHQIRMN